MPNPALPNNLLAPLWTDLNLGAGGNWYINILTDGVNDFLIMEWNDVPEWSDNSITHTFQVWIQLTGAGGIWYVYADIDPGLTWGTVGAENVDGTVGATYYYNGQGTAPSAGNDLKVVSTPGGSATITFQATIDECAAGDAIVNRADVNTADTSDTAIAVTQSVLEGSAQ